MIHCPNCGAGMRFEIKSQKLRCEYCEYTCAVDEHPFQDEEAKQDDYEVTVFSCPHCGGEISATDHAAVGICPYCRESSLLEGRLEKKQKPVYIIPFSVTKEDCKASYLQTVKKVWCVPREMKDETYLDQFQGIYLPYWVFHVKQEGHMDLTGHYDVYSGRSSTSYRCYYESDLDNDFPWICFDAASDFPDEASENINFFSYDKARSFSAGYLSGFFADIADVDADVYEQDAKDAAAFLALESISHFCRNDTEPKYLDLHENMPAYLHTKIKDTKSGLFPVWFLAWKHKNRCAYGVVNGENGRISTNFPVSMPAFLLMTLLLAVPFVFLYGAFTYMSWITSATFILAGFIMVMGVLSMHTHTMHQVTEGYDLILDKGKQGDQLQSGNNNYDLWNLSAVGKSGWEPLKKITWGNPAMSLQSKGQKGKRRRLLETMLFPVIFAALICGYIIFYRLEGLIKGTYKTWEESGELVEFLASSYRPVLWIGIILIFAIRMVMVIVDCLPGLKEKRSRIIMTELIVLNIMPMISVILIGFFYTRSDLRLVATGILMLTTAASCLLQIFHINQGTLKTITRYHVNTNQEAGSN